MPGSPDPRISQAAEALLDAVADADREQVSAAVQFAVAAHDGQRRKSGEPFVCHPLSVAAILAREGLAAPTICAGVLHDTVEDTGATVADISSQFGPEVAAMVDGVTKIQRIAARGTPQREKLETYRKLVLASAEDLRTLLVKLADRLDNMRSLQALAPDRQQAIARETLEVYAPLAHRLGMAAFKDELEDLAFRISDPGAWQEAGAVQAQQGRASGQRMKEMSGRLQAALEGAGVPAQISARVKSRYSIARKLQAGGGELHDIFGLRIITETEAGCYAALGLVHAAYAPRFDRFKDYIAVPKANLYRSLHTTVIGAGAIPVEVQIRTARMHEAAEHGIAAHWQYKEQLSGGGPAPTRAWAQRLREAAGSPDPQDAFDALRREAFEEEIYVFTPQGDIRLLPAGSTPVDFAYAVHSELGHRCVGARVNGDLRPLSAPLQSGDTVEVLRGKEVRPRRDWLNSAVSARARSRIRAWLARQSEPELIERGLAALQDGLKAAGLEPLAAPGPLAAEAAKLGYVSLDRCAVDAARPDKARALVQRIIRGLAEPGPGPAGEAPRHPERRGKAPAGDGVLVEGQTGIPVRLAGCCTPHPGDRIEGFVSMHRGVAVHRADCRQLARTGERAKARAIAVEWEQGAESNFRFEVAAVFADRPELMADIATAVYAEGSGLVEISMRVQRGLVRGKVAVSASSPAQAEQVRAALESLDGAVSVRRA